MTTTLTNDPFENDGGTFLEWAYGEWAGKQFADRVINLFDRPGQAFMNVLRVTDPAAYAKISGSNVDPFYVDEKIPLAIDKITSK